MIYIEKIIGKYVVRHINQRAIVYCPSVEFSNQLTAKFNECRIPAASTSIAGPDCIYRTAAFNAYRLGELMVLCAVTDAVIAEDIRADVVIDFKPTNSTAAVQAMIARAKTDYVCLSGNRNRHKTMDASHTINFDFSETL